MLIWLGYNPVLRGMDCVKIVWRVKFIMLTARLPLHHGYVIMSAMASQITSLTIVYSTVYSGADQRKHQSCASLAFVRGIHQWPVNSPHKGPVMQKNVSIWWRRLGKYRKLWLGLPVTHWGRVKHLCIYEISLHWCWTGNKPLSGPMLTYCLFNPEEWTSVKF